MFGYSSVDNKTYSGWFTLEMEQDYRKSFCLHGEWHLSSAWLDSHKCTKAGECIAGVSRLGTWSRYLCRHDIGS